MDMDNGILTKNDRIICTALIQRQDGLNRQRAEALLLLDGGASRAEAAGKSGLTKDQVHYLIRKFRQVGMTFFPDAACVELEKKPVATEPLHRQEISLKEALAEDTDSKPHKKHKKKKGKKKSASADGQPKKKKEKKKKNKEKKLKKTK
jgi:hypothetical protein